MRLKEIKQIISEVPMNPGAYAQSVDTGADKGVKIGFEFEVCVPKETITGKKKEEPTGPQGWWTKVLAEHPGDKWAEQLDPDGIFDYTVSLKKDIEFNGKKFKKNEDEIHYIYNTWSAKIIEPKVKAVFEKCGPKIKQRMLTRWKEVLTDDDSIDNNAFEFAQTCIYCTNNEKLARAFRQSRFVNSKLNKQFWIDVFGTADLAVLANDPRLDWDADQVLDDFGIYEDDDDDYYGSGDYDKTARVMKPVIEQAFGKTIIFNRYHERKKDTTSWYIEPDGSICPGVVDPEHPDDSDATRSNGDGACEIVTPPMPVKQGIEALKTFYSIAKQMGLYTSKGNGTGLHINVSIPEKLDVLKLAVFVGDEYVLKSWGREDNHYVDSIIKSLKDEYEGMEVWDARKREDVPYNPSVKSHYKELLQIAKSTSDEHTASVSFNGKYVSFRHAGGDYLNQQQAVIDVVGRFVRAMVIAADPKAYRKEYLAKLLKLTQGDQPQKKQDMQISNILAYKGKPINGVWYAVFGIKGNISVKNLLDRQQLFSMESSGNDSPMHPCPATQAPAAYEEVIAAGNMTPHSDLKTHLLKIKQHSTKRAIYFSLGEQNKIQRYSDEEIYARGYRYNELGVASLAGFQAQPGTPIHAVLFKELVDEAKVEMLANKRRRANGPQANTGARNPGYYGPGPGRAVRGQGRR